MTNINNLIKNNKHSVLLRKHLNSISPKQQKQLEYENNLLENLFSNVIQEKLSYNDIKRKIESVWFENYYNKLEHDYLSYESLEDYIKNMCYEKINTKYKIQLKYENIIYRQIIKDLMKSDLNYKAYSRIIKLNLFDKNYYISTYNYNLQIDPLLHYIYIGYLEGKNPSSEFNGNYYTRFNKNLSNSNLNPLVYLVLFGIEEGIVQINKDAWQPLSINRFNVNNKILKFDKVGISNKKRSPRLIVSLSSYSKRIDDIKYTLYSLFNQQLKPDMIVLWLSLDEFPNLEDNLPKSVLDFKSNGLTINWCLDIKSYKKIIPSLKKYSDDIIVTADDDIYYPPNWLEILYEEHLKHPNDIIAHRCKKVSFDSAGNIELYKNWELIKNKEDSSYLNFFTTGGGVLFPPHSLSIDVLDYETSLKLCPCADDIWLWGMSLLHNTKTRIPENNIHRLRYVNLYREVFNNKETLWYHNQNYNDKQLENMIKHYPEIKQILNE